MSTIMFHNPATYDDGNGVDTVLELMKQIDVKHTDDGTINFKSKKIVNVERDSESCTTVYFDKCGWYMTLSEKEWEMIVNRMDAREDFKTYEYDVFILNENLNEVADLHKVKATSAKAAAMAALTISPDDCERYEIDVKKIKEA